MRKLLTLALCLVLAISTCMMTACGGEDKTFAGNYSQEITIDQLVEDIQTENDVDIGGLSIDLGFNLTYNMGEQKMSTDVDLDFALQVVEAQSEAEETKLIGAGSFNIKDKGIFSKAGASMDAKVYLDEQYIYADAKASAGDESNSAKQKISILELLEEIDSIGDPEMDLSSLLVAAKFYKADSTDSKKYKISITKEDLLANIEDLPVEVTEYMTVNELAIYLVFTNDNAFSALKVDVNVELASDGNSIAAQSLKVVLDFELTVRVGDVTVTLPDLSDFEETTLS